MNIDYVAIGRRVQRARKAKNYSQEKLSELLDISTGYLSRIENGRAEVNLKLLARIAHYLSVDISNLVSHSTTSVIPLPDEIAVLLENCPPKKIKMITDIVRIIIRS